MKIGGFSSKGRLSFEFNQDFSVPEEVKAVTLKTGEQSSEEKETAIVEQLRMLVESKEAEVAEVDLSSFVKFELIRGANDSASLDDLNFFVFVTEFTPRKLEL